MPEADGDHTTTSAERIDNHPALPDAALLKAAHEVLELRGEVQRLISTHMALWRTGAPAEEKARCTVQRDGAQDRLRDLQRVCTKLPATTPAGILVKALLVEKSGNAMALARSLCRDLRANPALRRAIWPAEVV